MKKTIRRTIYTTEVYPALVSYGENGVEVKDLPALEFPGERLSKEKALKEVIKRHGKNQQYVIKELKVIENLYEIDFEDFMTHARKIEKPNINTINN